MGHGVVELVDSFCDWLVDFGMKFLFYDSVCFYFKYTFLIVVQLFSDFEHDVCFSWIGIYTYHVRSLL